MRRRWPLSWVGTDHYLSERAADVARENAAKLRALAERFEGGPPPGLVRTHCCTGCRAPDDVALQARAGRRCVASGALLHLTLLDNKVHERHYELLSDLLLLCKGRGVRFVRALCCDRATQPLDGAAGARRRTTRDWRSKSRRRSPGASRSCVFVRCVSTQRHSARVRPLVSADAALFGRVAEQLKFLVEARCESALSRAT